MDIRKAELGDLDNLARMFDDYRQFYCQASDIVAAKEFLRERLAQQESVILIACDGTKSVGFVQLFPSFSSVSMRRIFILNDLYVASSARKQGVASALLEEAVRYAAKAGALRLALATETTNTSAQALYRKLGWVKNEAFMHFDKNTEA